MAEVTTIAAERRDRAGKGSARAARREGRVPCVIYGGKQDPEMVTIPLNEMVRLMNRGGFMSHQYLIEFDGKSERVLPRDLQLHPVSDVPQHVDFLRLTKGQKVTLDVPVRIVGEDDSPGLRRGGVLNLVRDLVELSVPNDAIPEFIELSVEGLDLGDQARISRATLPEGVTPTITDRDFVVATIVAPSGLKSDDAATEEEVEEEVEEGGEE